MPSFIGLENFDLEPRALGEDDLPKNTVVFSIKHNHASQTYPGAIWASTTLLPY